MTIDPQDFRNALGNFATGITIVTTQHEDVRLGVTINSFASVSLDPPLVLFSLNEDSALNEIFVKSGKFNIGMLSADQEQVSNQFAGSAEDKFNGVVWTAGENGIPRIDNTLADLECDLETTYQGGDHTIYIGRVTHIHNNEPTKPLLYFLGNYAQL